MSRSHRRGFANIEMMLTPLIDMAFLLIVFFVLVSHIAIVDTVKMELPSPASSIASRPGEEPRAVINAIADDSGELATYRLAGHDYLATADGRGALGEAISQLLREHPATELALRADRRLPWRSIAPIFEAASRSAAVATPGRPVRMRLVVAEE